MKKKKRKEKRLTTFLEKKFKFKSKSLNQLHEIWCKVPVPIFSRLTALGVTHTISDSLLLRIVQGLPPTDTVASEVNPNPVNVMLAPPEFLRDN